MAEIYHWPPATISDNSENYSEIITISESGYEQRRKKASRSLASFTFNYTSRSKETRNEIAAFLRARYGPHEWFWIPSYMWDSSVKTAYTTGTTLYVNSNALFIEALAIGRKYIFIVNSSGQYEVKEFSGTVSTDRITLVSALSYDYPVGSEVDICFRARLDADSFVINDESYYKHHLSIPFREVR